MQALSKYRRWQLWALEKNLLNYEHTLANITDPSAFDNRDGGDGWNISEVLGHLADVDSYFLARAHSLANNDEPPPSSGKSPDEMVKAADYAQQNPLQLFDKWKQARLEYQSFLASLPDDNSVWERPGRDGDGSGFTLNDQLMLSAYHDCDHLHQIIKIIQGLPA